MSTKNILCRYYQYGYCRLGDTCTFSHDYKLNEPTQVCRYFLKGKCPFNKKCRYDHIKPNKPNFDGTEVAEPIPTTSKSITKCINENDLKSIPIKEDIKNYVLNPNAKEFNPNISSIKTYSNALMVNVPLDSQDIRPLCPYLIETGECSLYLWEQEQETQVSDEHKCPYVHGEWCDVCQKHALHPFNLDLRKEHNEACCKQMQIEMEFAFAVQRSEEKTCGICLEKVIGSYLDSYEAQDKSENPDNDEKVKSKIVTTFTNPSRRFGILPNCQHCYCLSCIMEWRKTKNQTIDHTNVRSCPECRVQSFFIIPSKLWIEDKTEKEKLIDDYKKSLSEKPCKYFRHGTGVCPLNDICFYKHAYPDGTIAPRNIGGPRRRLNGSGRSRGRSNLATELLLWDFFAARFDSLEFLGDNFDFISLNDHDDYDDMSDYENDFDDFYDNEDDDDEVDLDDYVDGDDLLFLAEIDRSDIERYYNTYGGREEGTEGVPYNEREEAWRSPTPLNNSSNVAIVDSNRSTTTGTGNNNQTDNNSTTTNNRRRRNRRNNRRNRSDNQQQNRSFIFVTSGNNNNALPSNNTNGNHGNDHNHTPSSNNENTYSDVDNLNNFFLSLAAAGQRSNISSNNNNNRNGNNTNNTSSSRRRHH